MKNTQRGQAISKKPTSDNATKKRPGLMLPGRLQAYRDQHAQALFSSLGRMFETPFSTLVTVVVLAITISLAGGFYLLVANLQQLTGSLEDSNQILLFLKNDISESQADQFADSLRKDDGVQSVKLISKEQGFKDFEKYSGFGPAIGQLEVNPLPIVLEVLPKNTLETEEKLVSLFDELKRAVEVDYAQMDRQWVQRLQNIVAIAKRVTVIMGLLLGIAVLFVTGNTIRMEAYNRQNEIIIAKLVGATNSFVQRPFLYYGLWLGFFSGTLAWFIITVMMLLIRGKVQELSVLYDGAFKLLFFDYAESITLIALSCLLAVLGSYLVLQFQLRKINVS